MFNLCQNGRIKIRNMCSYYNNDNVPPACQIYSKIVLKHKHIKLGATIRASLLQH